jgi:hypothetical protein
MTKPATFHLQHRIRQRRWLEIFSRSFSGLDKLDLCRHLCDVVCTSAGVEGRGKRGHPVT